MIFGLYRKVFEIKLIVAELKKQKLLQLVSSSPSMWLVFGDANVSKNVCYDIYVIDVNLRF